MRRGTASTTTAETAALRFLRVPFQLLHFWVIRVLILGKVFLKGVSQE